jgi:hypothetical protein
LGSLLSGFNNGLGSGSSELQPRRYVSIALLLSPDPTDKRAQGLGVGVAQFSETSHRSILLDGFVRPVVWIGEDIRPNPGKFLAFALGARIEKKNAPGVVLHFRVLTRPARALLKARHSFSS